jgi:hypothetical protein
MLVRAFLEFPFMIPVDNMTSSLSLSRAWARQQGAEEGGLRSFQFGGMCHLASFRGRVACRRLHLPWKGPTRSRLVLDIFTYGT